MKRKLLIIITIAAFGLTISCKNPTQETSDSNDDYMERREWVLGLFRDHQIRKHPKQGSPEVPVRLFLTNGEDREALEYITAVFDEIRESKNTGQVRNATPALVRTLYMFGEHFSDDQIQRIKSSVTSEAVGTRLNSHGTENHAAQFVVFNTLLSPGKNIVTSPYLYGGTFNQFKVTFRNFGWEARFAESLDTDD